MSIKDLFKVVAAAAEDPNDDVLNMIASKVKLADKKFEDEAKKKVVDHKELAYSYSL